MISGPVCRHHYRSGKVSTKVGADSTAWMVETAGWKVGDARLRSTNNEGRRGNGVRGRCELVRHYDREGAYFGRLGIQASRHFSVECN
jgi:hypothetical protein